MNLVDEHEIEQLFFEHMTKMTENWDVPGQQELYLHFLQGLERIGYLTIDSVTGEYCVVRERDGFEVDG